MKRLMMAHILCAGLLMLSLESQGAGAGKKVAPKKKLVAKKKKSAAAGAGAAAQPKKKLVKTPPAAQPKPVVAKPVAKKPVEGAGAPPPVPAIPAVPALPGGELELFFADIVKGDLKKINETIINNPSLLTMTDKDGNNALIVASRAGKNDVVLRLLFSDSIKKNINNTNKQGHDALYYANLEIANLLLKAGARPPLPAGMPPIEEKKKVAAGVGAGSPPAIPAWKEEKKKEAAGAGTPPPIPAWTVKTITDPNDPVNVTLKERMDFYTSRDYAWKWLQSDKEEQQKIVRLLEQGANPKLIPKGNIKNVLLRYVDGSIREHGMYPLQIRNYPVLFKLLGATADAFDTALYRILYYWGDDNASSALESLITAYKNAGGSFDGTIGQSLTGLQLYHDTEKALNIFDAVAQRLIEEGATVGKISKYATSAIVKRIQAIMKEREEGIKQAGVAASLPAPIADIIAEYEGSKVPKEQSATVGFEKEEGAPAVAGAPQLGSGMSLGGLAEDVAAGAGAGAPPAIPAWTEEEEGGASVSVMEQVG